MVGEQADTDAAGWWRNGHFHLQSELTADGLSDFFLSSYAPTPVASPWNGGGGFFPGEDNDPRLAIAADASSRLEAFRETLQTITDVISELKLEEPPSQEAKIAFILQLKERLPKSGQRWLGSAFTFAAGDFSYNSLFFSGGNDARFDLTTSTFRRKTNGRRP